MGKSKKSNQKKKEKIVYVDDGRTLADMSGVGSMGRMSKSASGAGAGKKSSSKPTHHATRQRAPYREHLKTYWEAVKLMFFPMLVVLGIIAVAFLIVYILL